ncbi:MAG: type II toxin-antitoxin system RelE/ParE family toxin [Sphingomonas phyllosphaerae]|uniref:type II toxin-antitoxin system RelE/ParE family toxin n=1 Tax=Sphingomonas phyllosphaerae TaxID=257003 RepID=UPI002FF6508A
MIVVLSPRSSRNLIEIGRYIARDDPDRAARFVAELLSACDDLSTFPRAYPADPRFGPAARRRTLGNYHIIYDVLDDRVVVLTIVHAARDPDAML